MARSYSDALFTLALEEKKLDLIKEQLCFVDEIIKENHDFLYLMTHPKVHKDEKKQTIQAIFFGQVDRTLLNFLKLLVDKGRFYDLHEIAKQFMNQYRMINDIVVAEVRSAQPLSDEEASRIHDMLEKKLRQQVEMHVSVDRELLAGIRIKVNDLVLDYTASSKMEHLKRLAVNANSHKESECERE